jgi:hypothetical protein
MQLYVKGATVLPPDIYMINGSALHSALAFNYSQKIVSRKDLPVQDVIDKYKSTFESECVKADIYYKNVKDELILSAENTLHNYMGVIAPTIQPTHVEWFFKIPLKKYPITILGYIDLIDENGFIIDHKSAGKSWKTTWKGDMISDSIQMRLYAGAYRKTFKKREMGLAFDVLPRDPKCLYKRFLGTVSDDAVENVLKMASTIEDIIKLGVFIPNLNSCSGCPQKNTCSKEPVIVH